MPLSVPAAASGTSIGTVEISHNATGAGNVTFNNLNAVAQQWFQITGFGNSELTGLVTGTYEFRFELLTTIQEPAANVNFPLDPFGTTNYLGINGVRVNGFLIPFGPNLNRIIPSDDGAGNWTIGGGNYQAYAVPTWAAIGDVIQFTFNAGCWNAITNSPSFLLAYRCWIFEQVF